MALDLLPQESDEDKELYAWAKAHLFLWPFLMAFQLHFVLAFTEKTRICRNIPLLALVYVPAGIFSFLNVATDLFQRTPVEESWGWLLLPPEGTPIVVAANVWVVGMAVLPFSLSLSYSCF